ncbi:hypothetical protein CLOLEP_01227 [[Clostridium] leptum DSM 753]|uniref:Uncharacterized protein n=1 Tax=[Clostridium] leptum DSM 753 TaxID=428125 RepID=A7VRP3_9FIRM|nr:hypothetical protein CLOLEP_01227 [[Clostridium] leptum DSM 753]
MARLLRAGASSSAVIFYPSARVFHPVENTGLLAGLAAPWRFLQNFYKFFILSFDTSVFYFTEIGFSGSLVFKPFKAGR